MMVPNHLYGQPDVFDRSGMQLAVAGDRWTVGRVVAAGPAARAGIARGDTIVSIEGLHPADLPPGGLRSLMRRPPGTRVHLGVEAGGDHEVVITLADVL